MNASGDEEYEEFTSFGWQSATIDEMEIEACIFGLREVNKLRLDWDSFSRVLLFSDSRYVVDNFFRAMKVWPKKKWLGSNDMPVKNIDLWKRLRREVNKCPMRVDVEWVKGHKSSKYNRLADKLAKPCPLKSREMSPNFPLALGTVLLTPAA